MRFMALLALSGGLIAGELPIGGIAHVGFRVADLEKTRAFYSGVLGFQQAFEQKNAAGVVDLAVFQINDDQFLEFTPGVVEGGADPFTHVAFLTEKLEEVRGLVEQMGLNPPQLRTGRDRTRNFSIQDGDGHKVEFIRYEPDSLQARARGRLADDRRVARHLHHLGLAVTDREFWTGKLGAAVGSVEFLPAGSRSYLSLDGGRTARELRDPDGIRIQVLP